MISRVDIIQDLILMMLTILFKIMKDLKYYETRILLPEIGSESLRFEGNGKTLIEFLHEDEKLLVIGNPGIGKSEELKKLFDNLWDIREKTGVLPLIINLQKFRNTHKFDDLIRYDKWRNHQNIVFILDGLDEIANIQDFLSELSVFTGKNSSRNFKYVISCRYNIYLSNKTGLSDFKKLYLDNLNLLQAQNILKNKFEIDLPIEELHKFEYLLTTPFILDQFAKFYKEYGTIPTNFSQLIDTIINCELEAHTTRKVVKRNKLPLPKLRYNLNLIALINELRQRNSLNNSQILKVVGDDFSDFIENPFFIPVNEKNEEFMFRHRQYQEYFVANLLNRLSFDDIIRVVGINKNRVKPSLLNSISFLLNLMKSDDSKYNDLIQWISTNEPEILFKADPDRIADLQENIQEKVFQKFFQKNIIDSKLWLRNTTSVSEEEIAQFADCEKNFKFLIDIAKAEKEHFRTRATALSLLAHFEPRPKAKAELLKLLKPNTDNAYRNINSGVIDVFKYWKLVKREPKIISEVIEVFNDDEHSEPASRILSLILTDLEHLDKYMPFIEREMKFEFDREKRENDDGVIRGNRWKLERMLTEIQNDDLFLNYLELLLNQSKFDSYNSEHFEKDIFKRLNVIKETKENKLVDFFTDFFKEYTPDYYNHRKPSYRIVKSLGISKALFERLFEPEFFKENYGILAHLYYLDPSCYENFAANIKNFKGLDKHLEYFRNNINSYNDRESALLIEKILEENDFELTQKLSDHKSFGEIQKEFNKLIQQEVELMFEKSELYKLCENHFKESRKDSVCKKDFYATKRDFKNNSQLVNTFGYETLAERIIFKACIYFNKDCVNLKDCREYLDDEMAHFEFIFKEIQSHKGNTHLNIDFTEINAKLQVLVSSISESVKTDNLISFSEDGSFSLNKEYPSFLMIQNIHQLLIDDTLTLKASDEFILNTLAYFDFKNFDNDTSKFVKLTDKITDKDKLKEKIIANLQTELVSSVYTKHALFALNHGYLEAFKDIEAHLLKDKDIYSGDALLIPFVEKNGTDILKKMCDDLHTRACWTAIEMLFKDGSDKEFCINKAKEYLASKEDKYIKYAAKVLFETNEKAIIDYILKDVENRIKVLYSLNHTNFQNYSVVPSNGLSGIKTLFNKIYSETDFDDHDFSYSNSFFINYSINLVTHQKKYLELKDLFEKQRVIAEEKDADRKIFFVNSLLKDIEKAHINSLSKAMDFEDALKLVKEVVER